MALPNYAMSCFKLPIGVCKDIEKAIRNYWWRNNEKSRGVHWTSWDRLTRKKMAGGLGFKDIQCFNLAFLAKVGWRLIHNPSSLLATVLQEKYYQGKTFREADKGQNTSWGWKGIFEARKILRKGLRWRVGDGASINIKQDPWFPKPSTFTVRPMERLEGTWVRDLIDPNLRSWRTDLILNGFQREDAMTILCMPLSKTGGGDRLIWHHSSNGEYSVKSGYDIAVQLLENGDLGKKGCGAPSDWKKNSYAWNKIWDLKVPNKIKVFMWKCCNKALAVRHNLKRRHMRVDNVCGVCNCLDETENHLFFQCEFSHMFWFCSSLHLNSFELAGKDFFESWEKLCIQLKNRDHAEDIAQDFAFGLWRLWKNRNNAVFKGVQCHPLEALNDWRMNVSEYREALSCDMGNEVNRRTESVKSLKGMGTQWRKPGFGSIKINTDAAWCKKTLRMGTGWVARDFAGILKAAGGSGNGFCDSAAVAEACAIREALEACIHNGFTHIIIESDAHVIIQMIERKVAWNVSLECILCDIVNLALRLTSVAFVFTPRECNLAAHSVAKHVFLMGSVISWDHIGPEFLFNILAQDVNISIRL